MIRDRAMADPRSCLITGGAGFAVGPLVAAARAAGYRIVLLDSGPGGRVPLPASALLEGGMTVFSGDPCDPELMIRLLRLHAIGTVFHLSLPDGPSEPAAAVEAEMLATTALLAAVRGRWLEAEAGADLRIVLAVGDDVVGDLPPGAPPWPPSAPLRPLWPAAAVRAAGCLLGLAWQRACGLPVIVAVCAEAIGRHQRPQALIPALVRTAIAGGPLAVAGDGGDSRCWLAVEDLCRGLLLAAGRGQPGETYGLGGEQEIPTLDLVRVACRQLDRLRPAPDGRGHAERLCFCPPPPGWDRRRALDGDKALKRLGFRPQRPLFEALQDTIAWYAARMPPAAAGAAPARRNRLA